MDMTTYGILNSILLELATTAASTAAYETWSDKFSRKEIREVWTDTEAPFRKPRNARFTVEQLRGLTGAELRTLGFANWDKNHWLIPLWAFNYIADGETLISISGNKVVKPSPEIDLDVRGGCIAFGFMPS